MSYATELYEVALRARETKKQKEINDIIKDINNEAEDGKTFLYIKTYRFDYYDEVIEALKAKELTVGKEYGHEDTLKISWEPGEKLPYDPWGNENKE
jgi:hypothetical protein